MKTVILSKRIAKWNLDNPEAWVNPKTGRLNGYNPVAQMSIAALLDVPIVGKVGRQGAEENIFAVYFDNEFGKDWGFFEFTKDGRMK